MSTDLSRTADGRAADPGGPARADRWSGLRRAAPALLGYAAVRAVGVLVLVFWPRREVGAMTRLSHLWDAPFYQRIAESWYRGVPPVPGPHGAYEAYAFFPGYPAAIRAVSWISPLSYAQAALLVAWACSLVAAWGIFAVADRLYGRRVGVLAAVLWGVLPVAVVESMAYSELMFTAFAVWAVYAAVTRNWIPAGALALCAGLCRPTGIAVAGAVGAAALWDLLSRRGPDAPARWRPLLGALLAPLGFVGYVGWVGYEKGSWDGYFKVQEAWQSTFDFGRSTLKSFAALLGRPDTVWLPQVVVAMVLCCAVLLFGVSVLQRQPLVLLLFSAGILVLALGDAAYFTSRARFLLPAVGLLLPVAAGLARVRTRGTVVLLLSGAALASAAYGGFLVYVYPDAP
ncbi:glycosyltransferase family 39 protein [Kitasatospora phosalacinea]|uniref:glycosyltransferase family 39 protein n=1 Tax=Kitasatospora phosalacinea TaxID=2065 RepID=UPI0005246307|nr:glycosyltransferase family 39 protein [Kitasatospora phosalacinea]